MTALHIDNIELLRRQMMLSDLLVEPWELVLDVKPGGPGADVDMERNADAGIVIE